MTGVNWFSLDGIRSDLFGIMLTEPLPEIFPQRDADNISIPGKSGDLILDHGRYKNVVLIAKCAIIPEAGRDLRQAAQEAACLLRPTGAYLRMADSYRQDLFRFARIAKEVTVESIVEQAGKFTVRFDCKPQRFLIIGESSVRLDAPEMLHNPTMFDAQPIITVYGSGPGTLSVGGCVVQIKELADQITLDCERMDAYRQVGDGGTENKNGAIYAPEFPLLKTGDNLITWDGGIAAVKIVPRWWTL